MYCLGCKCWEKNGKLLTLTHRNLWDVEFKGTMIGSASNRDRALEIAHKYMKENP